MHLKSLEIETSRRQRIDLQNQRHLRSLQKAHWGRMARNRLEDRINLYYRLSDGSKKQTGFEFLRPSVEGSLEDLSRSFPSFQVVPNLLLADMKRKKVVSLEAVCKRSMGSVVGEERNLQQSTLRGNSLDAKAIAENSTLLRRLGQPRTMDELSMIDSVEEDDEENWRRTGQPSRLSKQRKKNGRGWTGRLEDRRCKHHRRSHEGPSSS